MKKHNLFCWLSLSKPLCFISIILSLLLFGCKSAPVGRAVDPIELLDNNSSFYIAIPKAADSVLINRIIQNNVQGLSESDAKMISDRVNKIYCGLERKKNHVDIQASIDGNIPVKYIPKGLNSKNGFSVQKYTPAESNLNFDIYSNESIDLSFPSQNLCCLGRDVQGMLTKYDSLLTLPADYTEIVSELSPELIEYLKGAENEIRFFANKPQSFLTILTGAQLDLKLIDVKGSFVTDPKFENQYLLNIDFNFKNEMFMKAGRTLLTLAFGLTNSQSIVYGEAGLQINGIKLDKKQLYKLLVL